MRRGSSLEGKEGRVTEIDRNRGCPLGVMMDFGPKPADFKPTIYQPEWYRYAVICYKEVEVEIVSEYTKRHPPAVGKVPQM